MEEIRPIEEKSSKKCKKGKKMFEDDISKFVRIFKEQYEILLNTGDKTKLDIPLDSEIAKPKFGNSLIYITHQNKYSKETLKIFDNLYNNNACEEITNSLEEHMYCENIFNSILTKGLE